MKKNKISRLGLRLGLRFDLRFNLRKLNLGILILVLFIFTACDSIEKSTPGIPDVILETENTKEQTELIDSLNQNTDELRSQINGIILTKEQSANIPLSFVIENARSSRPQSGLSQADLVYEMEVEWGITRFLALYQSQTPSKIGPIRSTRKYIQELVKFNGISFAHAGGSNESIALIYKDGLRSINEMGLPRWFYRDKKRRAPHNLYTSYEKIKDYSLIKGYVGNPTIGLLFKDNVMDNYQNTANQIDLRVSSYVSVSYSYEDGVYKRYQDQKPHIDKETNSQLTTDTIIIQRVSSKQLNDAEKHISLELTGQGSMSIFADGKVIEGTWKRSNINSPTKFYDNDGRALFLPTGKIWWHIIRTGTRVVYQ